MHGRLDAGRTSSYDETTIENVIEALGLDIESETYNDWLVLCPIHGNTRDPSMTISKESGIHFCFNPSCNITGSLLDLVVAVKGINPLRAIRFIEKNSSGGKQNLGKLVSKALEQKEMPVFSRDVIENSYGALLNDTRAFNYLKGRGFNEKTIEHFKFGYSQHRDMIMTPMHDIKGNPVGVIGRSLEGKQFKNSQNLPVRQTLFNIHRARREGEEVIVTESNFDAALVHQAGYPCVVASLGGSFSDLKMSQLEKNFKKVIIMTDDDEAQKYSNCVKCQRSGHFACIGHRPGLSLGKKLAEKLEGQGLKVYWAYTGEGKKRLFGKDAGEMSEYQIKTVISNKISAFAASKLW